FSSEEVLYHAAHDSNRAAPGRREPSSGAQSQPSRLDRQSLHPDARSAGPLRGPKSDLQTAIRCTGNSRVSFSGGQAMNVNHFELKKTALLFSIYSTATSPNRRRASRV